MIMSIIRRHTSAGNSAPLLEVNRLVAMRLLDMRSKDLSKVESPKAGEIIPWQERVMEDLVVVASV